MKQMLQFLKTTILGGAVVVAPLWIGLLILLKVLSGAEFVVLPITDSLPHNAIHPQAIAAVLLLTICFLTGLVVRTTLGSYAKTAVESKLLERLPGYVTLRELSENLAGINKEQGFQVALAELDGASVIALVVEKHSSGQWTIFVPEAPTPFTGSIYILPAERVRLSKMPLAKALHCISRYGAGSHELLESITN